MDGDFEEFDMFQEMVDSILTVLPPSRHPDLRVIYTTALLMFNEVFAASVNETDESFKEFAAFHITKDLRNLLFLGCFK